MWHLEVDTAERAVTPGVFCSQNPSMILWKRMFAHSLNFSLAKGNLKLHSSLSLELSVWTQWETALAWQSEKQQGFFELLFPFLEAVCVCFGVGYLTWLFLFPEGERQGCGLGVRMVSSMSSDYVGVLMLNVSCFPVAWCTCWARGRALCYPSHVWTWKEEELLFDLLRRMDQSECSAGCLFVLLPALWSVHESAPWTLQRHQGCSAASF